MKLPSQEYWSGFPFPTLGQIPDPGIRSMSATSPALPVGFFTTEPPGKPLHILIADALSILLNKYCLN